MATVERRQQRPDGPTSYRVRWRDDTGAQRSKTFARRKDADRWRTKVEHDLLSGSYVDAVAGRITFGSYAETWLEAQPWAPTTAQRARSVFDRRLLPTLAPRPLGSIKPSELQGLVAALGKELAPSTVEVTAAMLTGLFGAAVRDRIIARNPCEGLRLPRATTAEVAPPTPDQVHLLIGHVDEQWRPVIVVLAGLGLRISEALGLTVRAVDFLGRQVRVERQVQQLTGKAPEVVDRLKTPASYRTVPLPDVVATALAGAIEHGAGPGGLIFHDRGEAIRRQRINYALDRACDAANKAAARRDRKAPAPFPQRIHPHDLRHFYASMLIASGASVKSVQRCMGHGQASETLDTYGHLWPDHDTLTRAAVDAVLAPRVASAWPETAAGA